MIKYILTFATVFVLCIFSCKKNPECYVCSKTNGGIERVCDVDFPDGDKYFDRLDQLESDGAECVLEQEFD